MTRNLGGDRRLISENCFEWQAVSEEHEPCSSVPCALFIPGPVVRAISTATEQFHFGSTLGPVARAIRSNRAPGRRGKLVSSFFLFLVGASLFFLCFSLFREDTNNPGEQGATYSRTFICSEDSSSCDVLWRAQSQLWRSSRPRRFVSFRIFRRLIF